MWYNKWINENEDVSIDRGLLDPICTNGNNLTINTTDTMTGSFNISAIDISQLNSDKLTFTFPEGEVELTYKELKVLKKLIQHLGKEMFPEEYI